MKDEEFTDEVTGTFAQDETKIEDNVEQYHQNQ